MEINREDGETYSDWLASRSFSFRYGVNRCSLAIIKAAKGAGIEPIAADLDAQAQYCARRLDGVSHSLAEMFALAQPPMSNTDREFTEGWVNGNQFEKTPWVGDYYKRQAESVGVDITGKRYLGGLARFPGDPEAWVSGRGDVQRVCETRGWACQGAVNVKAQAADSAPTEIGLADDIVDDKVGDILAGLPAAERPHVDTQDLREQVKEAYTPHWSK